ncbi:hypothetical protein, partial [Burkholderia pseudomallei]|uniref:hypothetical protein n=1 Tax=Burkholderia pseudomallei TaxID=28450 RepID=UPI00215621AC
RGVGTVGVVWSLARDGAGQERIDGLIEVAANRWPTAAVLDYHAILTRVKDFARRDEQRAQAGQILRARLTYRGTQLVFATARGDDLWWLMTSIDPNPACLALAVVGAAGRQGERPLVGSAPFREQTNRSRAKKQSQALRTPLL